MTNKIIAIVALVLTTAFVGYIIYNNLSESEKTEPVVSEVVFEEKVTPNPSPVQFKPGLISEYHPGRNVRKAFVVAQASKVESAVMLCNDMGLPVLSVAASPNSEYSLVVCHMKEDEDESNLEIIRRLPFVEFTSFDTPLVVDEFDVFPNTDEKPKLNTQPEIEKLEDTGFKSWDLNSWIDPLEEGAKVPQGDDENAEHNSTTEKQGPDQAARVSTNKRPL